MRSFTSAIRSICTPSQPKDELTPSISLLIMPITKFTASSTTPTTILIIFTTPLKIFVTTLPKILNIGASQPSNVPSICKGTCKACKTTFKGIRATDKSGCKMPNNACIATCIGVNIISTTDISISSNGETISNIACIMPITGCNASDIMFIATASTPPTRSIIGCKTCITKSSTCITASSAGCNASPSVDTRLFIESRNASHRV